MQYIAEQKLPEMHNQWLLAIQSMIAHDKVGCLTADGNVDVDLHRAPKHN